MLGVDQRLGTGIALLFHDRGTRRGWVVSSTPRPHFTPWNDPVPILQEAWWAAGPVWTGGKSRPHWDSIPNLPVRSSVAIPTELPALYIYIYIYIIRDKSRNREVVNISKPFCFIFYFSGEIFLLNNSYSLTGVCSCFACRTSLSSHYLCCK